MNPSKGIFGSSPESLDSDDAASSPFKALSGEDPSPPTNPFSNPDQQDSPFAAGSLDSTKPARIADPRPKTAGDASPFELAEPEEDFGYDAPDHATPASTTPATASPFAAAPEKAEESQPKPTEEPEPKPAPSPARQSAAATAKPSAPASEPAPASYDSMSYEQPEIRQLELRAIFGVDRELSAEEILQRLRSLSGIRNVTRVSPEAVAALDVLRRNLVSLVQESAAMRVTFGGSPVEFIRSGDACLAVINDGSFAPGVKETIIIAARELARMS